MSGPALVGGQRGRCELGTGTVELEIIGLGEREAVQNKPDIYVQLIQTRILAGDATALNGAVVEFL